MVIFLREGLKCNVNLREVKWFWLILDCKYFVKEKRFFKDISNYLNLKIMRVVREVCG